MTPQEAEQRIVLSREHLHRYVAAAAAGHLPAGDGYLVAQEITLLQGIAELHADKAMKIESLVNDWLALAHQMRAGLH